MYFLSKWPTITKENGNEVYTYDVVRNGEIDTIVGGSKTLVPTAGLYKVTFTGTKATKAEAFDAAIVAASPATTATAGVVANAGGSFYYDDKTVVYIIDGETPDDVVEASIESIVTEGGAVDSISMLLGTTIATNKTAKYVFIVREPVTSVGIAGIVPTDPVANGTADDNTDAPTVAPAMTMVSGQVKDGNTVLFDIGTELTTAIKATGATSAGIVKVKIPGKTTGANLTVDKYTTNWTTKQVNGGSGKIDGDDGTDGYVYVIVFNNTTGFSINDGTNTYYFTCTPW